MTDTTGFTMKTDSFSRMPSASWAAVNPSAATSCMRGMEILPSGRTTRSNVNSLLSQTDIRRWSSGPRRYDGSGVEPVAPGVADPAVGEFPTFAGIFTTVPDDPAVSSADTGEITGTAIN